MSFIANGIVEKFDTNLSVNTYSAATAIKEYV